MSALPLLMICAARERACGIMGIEDAPVPPKTEPKINTLALPDVVSVIKTLTNSFSPLGNFELAASTID